MPKLRTENSRVRKTVAVATWLTEDQAKFLLRLSLNRSIETDSRITVSDLLREALEEKYGFNKTGVGDRLST